MLDHDHPRTAAPALMDQTTGLASATPVATPQGWTPVADLRTGDPVFGSDGRIHRVEEAALLPAEDSTPTMVIGFSNGYEVATGPHQTWIGYDRTGRLRLNAASAGDKQRWAALSRQQSARLREHRTSISPTLEGTLVDVLRTLRRLDVNRWRDLNDLRYALAPYVPTVCGKPPSSPSAIWSISEALRYLDFRISRDVDAPYGRVLASCELPRLPLNGTWCVPGPAVLDGLGRKGEVPPRDLAAEVCLSAQAVPPQYLRAPSSQRLDLLRALVEASGVGAGVLRADNDRQLRSFTELLASLGLRHRVTWMRSSDSEDSLSARVAFEYPATSLPYVAIVSARFAPPRDRVALRVSSPDSSVLVAGLLVAHCGGVPGGPWAASAAEIDAAKVNAENAATGEAV